MKRRQQRIILFGAIISLGLTGCGKTVEETAGETVAVEEEVQLEETTEEEAQEEPVLEESEEIVPEVEEDSTVFGNTAGNILGGGLLLEDDDYFYLYHGYDNCVYKTEKKTGVSDRIADGYCLQLNLVDGMIYANHAQDSAIVEIDTESGEVNKIREGDVEYLITADKELYFTDVSDNSLRKYSLDSTEETVLVDQPIVTPCIYKDSVYFAMDNDEHYLYSVPRKGGEITQINGVYSFMPTMYKDKIYYLGMENEEYSIRSMELDGSDEKVIVETDAVFINLYEGKLYYVDGADKSKIYFLDLDSEDMVPEVLELEENIKEAVDRYAIEPATEYRLDRYMGLNFQQDHMAFMCMETIDGEQYMDEYIYDFSKDSIMPVAYFFVSREVLEAAMEESTKESKEESADIGETASAAPQAPARTYPAGNYSPGSVYGPKLSQAELNEVADAVQTYMNSYDFSSMSEYEKVATAHDYLCNTCEFAPDWRYNRANTAWGALIYHEAQCSGYSRAMKALCDAMGVGCYYVHADDNAINPSHQWNEVCIDGNWYIIDVQGNDKSGFRAFYLLSGDTYAAMSGMSWDRGSVPECPADYY